MRAGDILVHHPYDSFAASVERFVQQAVRDPDVLAIKMTVYRTSDDSALVPSLIEAAERGKQAVCLVELKARFDERRNIGWARALEEAGAHVVHGLPGLKTHAKALLVVRREGRGVRHYVHIGTGNYHAKTARLYEDFGLFTTDREIAQDVAELFNALTGIARSPDYRKAIVAPDHMRKWFLREVEQTIEAHRGRACQTRIVLKMNSLVDARCIRALYEASQAGVRVDLNMRGICCLRPGVPGVSENIRVVSVVGRFLEHSRVYGFQRGDERRYWIGSADLMPRNLDTRVELLAPVDGPKLVAELEDTLERCFADDTFAWELRPDETLGAPHGGHPLGAPRADGARAERASAEQPLAACLQGEHAGRRAPPDRRSRMRARSAPRARRSRRGKHVVPAAEPVISTRSAPARTERSAATATSGAPSTAWASRLSVTTTPSKPSSPRSRPADDRAADCDAIARGRAPGSRACEAITSGTPSAIAASNGTRSLLELAGRRSAGASSVLTCAPPRPGEVLGGRGHAARRACPRIDARVAAPRSRRRRPANVRDRPSRRTPRTRARRRPARGSRSRRRRAAARAASRARRSHLPRDRPAAAAPAAGPANGDGADVAALLVDHDEGAPARRGADRAREPRATGRASPPLRPNRITPAVSPARSRRRM